MSVPDEERAMVAVEGNTRRNREVEWRDEKEGTNATIVGYRRLMSGDNDNEHQRVNRERRR